MGVQRFMVIFMAAKPCVSNFKYYKLFSLFFLNLITFFKVFSNIYANVILVFKK